MSRQEACDLELVGAAQAIGVVNPDAEVLEQGETSLAQGAESYAGYTVALTHSSQGDSLFDGVDTPLRTELYLFCGMGGDWLVKYRFTHRADHDAAATEIAHFMRDLTLTVGAQRLGDEIRAERAPPPLSRAG